MSSIENIDHHVRSYRSALKSSLEITISSLTNSQLRIDSILHPLGKDPKNIDFSALIYSILRLPPEVDKTHLVLMGQNPQVFTDAGFPNVTSWKKITSRARRRTRYFNPHTHIGVSFISSISDVDDIVNLLIAYQSEWNKFHALLKSNYPTLQAFRQAIKSGKIITDLSISPKDWQSFLLALGKNYRLRLKRIYLRPQDIRLRLLAGSWIDYTKTVQFWWKNINLSYSSQTNEHLSQKRIYLVSSNLHSLSNLITGLPRIYKSTLISYLKKENSPLLETWQKIQSGDSLIPADDFLSFIFKNYSHLPEFQSDLNSSCARSGIISIPSSDYLDVNCQIFPISSLAKCKHLDPRLKISKAPALQRSSALILNIDYPLGFTAYHILNEILENVGKVCGLYILGKAAVLNSEIGDVEIPKVVFDEHTQNSYLFKNCFNTFFPFPNRQGSILTNQKAVSVLSAFLENEALMQKYMENNLTVVEMEAGPYLSAVTEATYDQQLPRNTIVDLNSAPFDIGIINYTSDTPYSQAKNLGAGSLELNGIEPVYLGSLAILQRIINLEESSL
jgi:hypothetical protein